MTVTNRARLELVFGRLYVPSVGCFLTVTTNGINTQPISLLKPLVVQKATPYTTPEGLLRIVEEVDLSLPVLPSALTRFSSATYAALIPQVGDKIHIGVGTYSLPPLWQYVYNYSGAHEYIVSDASDPLNLEVSPAFPDYGEGITFNVQRLSGSYVIAPSTPASDGVANRDYDPLELSSLYLTERHYDFVGDDVDMALNRVEAYRAQAEAIVTVLNQDTYSGETTELFE